MNIEVNAQSSIKLNLDKVIYFDPYLIKNSSCDADYVFITHSHYDHYSFDDILKVMNSNTKFIVPNSVYLDLKDRFKNEIIVVEPGKNYLVDNMSVLCTYAYNINKPYHKKSDLFVGYVVDVDGVKYFVAGDTDNVDELSDIVCDYAFVPIGGTYTMDYVEASDLINKIKPKYTIPIHYKTIVGSDEDVKKFSDRVEKVINVCIKF